ncbi:hypothetical protein RND71_044137 [Anisodus tanguticus]|uniref:Protein kinase domain-containing protein n=1 Tax=Anisodus tanguticus TaxID=243964 RepID=A0AAE1QRF2_9SOLA|nr:hypothetical protein RND71_044137 [Anisodus tanguticus]
MNDEKVSAIRLNSQESQTSDYDQNDPAWPRQNSLTLKEWDIPFDELVKEKEIGTGLFGTVFKGKWHGSVAIKMFNMANGLDNKEALEAFRSEIATLRKTRHENLVLFMGSCMKPPHLAIVTSYCQGLPLYTHLYERKEKFNLNRIISIGQQISQGMGYLHAREQPSFHISIKHSVEFILSERQQKVPYVLSGELDQERPSTTQGRSITIIFLNIYR